MKITFLNFPSDSPPLTVRNSVTNQSYQKKFEVYENLKTKNKTSFKDFSLHFSFLNRPNFAYHFLESFEK